MLAQRPTNLSRTLARLCWQFPTLIAAVGMAYVLGDQLLLGYRQEAWPHVLLGVLVLGAIGPLLSWRTLSWAALAARERETAERELQRRNEQCAATYAIAGAVNHSLDLDEVLTLSLDKLLELMRLETGQFWLVDGDRLVPSVRRGVGSEAIADDCGAQLGECLCGAAALQGEMRAVGDLVQGDGVSLSWCRSRQYRAVLSLPVRSQGRVSGVLHLASRAPREFAPHDRQMLTSVGLQIGVAIEKAHLYTEVRDLNHRLQQRVEAQAAELVGARDEVADKARQLQHVLIEMMSLQERERARIAYDMHDRAVQLIVGALYQIQAARQHVTGGPPPAGDPRPEVADPHQARAVAVLQTAQTMLKELETEIRQAIFDLRPPALDSLGLVPALRDYAGHFRELAGFPCAVNSIGPARRLPAEVEVAVYRIVQEALHNIARHADASRAEVTLDFRGPNLWVSVSDDGRGFDTEAAHSQSVQHLGLISMRERALAIHGELRILAAPGHGTQVMLTVPVPAGVKRAAR